MSEIETVQESHPHLARYLARQRWFGVAEDDFVVVAVEPLGWLGDPLAGMGVRVELVSIETGSGARQTYNVPLSYRRQQLESIAYGLVGVESWSEGEFFVYDALHDPEARSALMAGFFTDVSRGDLRYTRTAELEIGPDSPSVVLAVEQSNTSIVVDETVLLKVFRKVVPGRNPDIEIHAALAEQGHESVATLEGWISTDLGNPEGDYDLAMAQRFLRTATDGWESARASVRDLLAEPDLQAADAGGDFAADAERLGATTAHVHGMLAERLPTATWEQGELRALTARLHARLDEALAQAPAIQAHEAQIRARYDAISDIDAAIQAQRVHGDFHLGQTLRTTAGWKIIDFEGEPSKSLLERTGLDSPARDIAGMLRSLDYAAHSVLLQTGAFDATQQRQAGDWVAHNREAFLRGYGFSTDRVPAILLGAYEVDKAVYEVVYELHHRPDWVDIPMWALDRLLGERGML